MDCTEERIERNNNIFREANERIRAAAEAFDHGVDRIPFLCECPVEGCVEVVPLTQTEYAELRANPSLFMTVAGHEDRERPAADVLERRDGYVIVEKR